MSMPKPPMAFLLMRVAKFFGPSSSAPDGGPRGCLVGWLTILWPAGTEVVGFACPACSTMGGVAETGRPRPRPSKSLLLASSRGERGVSLEDEERGVVGDEFDAADLTDDPEDCVSPSVSSSVLSMVTAGRGCETTGLKRRG